MSAIRVGPQAVRWSKAQETWAPGHCLQFVRTGNLVAPMMNASPPGGTARIAWDRCPTKHRTDDGIPHGAPVWIFGLGPAEHIVRYDVNGRATGTDFPRTGQVSTFDLADLEAQWGCFVIGWGEHLNGVRVVPRVDMKRVERHAVNADVRAFQYALRRWLGLAKARRLNPAGVTGRYGGQTADMVRAVKHDMGLATGNVWHPGNRLARRLGMAPE